MSATKALGYKRDAHDPRDFMTEHLYGSPLASSVIVPASMRKWRKGVLMQGQAGSCVAHALDRGIDLALRFAAERAGDPEPNLPKASRRFMYYNARRQEAVDAIAAGHEAPTVHDGGCFPRFAMRAVQKLGFCEEAFFPYSDDKDSINEIPPPTAYQRAYDQKDFTYARNDFVGNARVAEVARGLALGFPSIFGMFVDTGFFDNHGAQIQKINTTDPNGGGHMLCVLEVTADDVIFDNWWGTDWGSNDGIGRMSHALFGSSIITDIYAIKAAPIFSEVKP